jgi:hypothetical protein
VVYSLQHINFKNPIYTILVALVITGSLFFTACDSHNPAKHPANNAVPEVFSDSVHHTVQQGIASTIRITAKPSPNYWHQNTQLSLIPAGPYVSRRYPLAFRPLAITSDGHYAYVATSSNKKNYSNMLVIQLKPGGQSKPLSEKLLINGVITKLVYKNKRLIFALKHGGIKVLDVSKPTSPVTILNHPTNSPVLDIQVDKQSVYLLLKNNTLLEISLAPDATDKTPGKLENKWKLPVPAISIAVRSKLVILAGPEGIATVMLTNTSARLIDKHKTSGNPQNIQAIDNLAFVADGPGGLIVFRIEPDGHLLWVGSYNKRGAINSISTTRSGNKIVSLASLSNGNIMSIDLTNSELPGSGVMFKPQQAILAATLLNTLNTSPGKTSLQSDVLLATENSLLWVVMTGNNNQLISSEGVNQGGSRRGVIRDNILYVDDWFSGLHLYDISNPKQIKHLSNYHTPGSSKGVVLLDHYALVGDDDQGLQIINIKNPLQPHWVSELTPKSLSGVGLAYTMKLVKNTLYLADHRGGFHIIDLSDIKHPKRLGGYNTSGKSWGIDVVNNFVFVADDTSGLLIFDASDVSNPNLVGHFDPGGQAEDVLIKNNLAYVTFFDDGLYILDIGQPQKPKVIGHISIPGNARGLALDKNLAYIAGWESGLHIVDISEPSTPHILGSYDTDGAAWGVNIKDGIVYVLDWWGGIKVINVQQPSKPAYLGQYHARGTLQQMRSKNKYLYTASGSGGLQVFDIKNPLNPIWSTGVDLNGDAVDVWLDEDRAYVATGKNGIVILDTLDPFYTHRIGLVNTPGQALRVRAFNEILYLQDTLAGLMVIDVREPQRPRELGRYPIQINDLWMDDNVLWVSTTQGLAWWQHSDDGNLKNKKLLTIPGGTNWVRSQNDLVVTADKGGVIKLWRKTPEGLIPLSHYKTRESLSDLQLKQDTLYVLGQQSGLMAINISDPKTPRLTTVYPATGNHTRFEIAQGAAFFSGESRLASVTLLPSTGLTSTIITHTNRPNEAEILLPADLPIGQYHLLATTPAGQRELLPNAITVQFSAPGQDKSSLKAMRQMLKSPLKPPTER